MNCGGGGPWTRAPRTAAGAGRAGPTLPQVDAAQVRAWRALRRRATSATLFSALRNFHRYQIVKILFSKVNFLLFRSRAIQSTTWRLNINFERVSYIMTGKRCTSSKRRTRGSALGGPGNSAARGGPEAPARPQGAGRQASRHGNGSLTGRDGVRARRQLGAASPPPLAKTTAICTTMKHPYPLASQF